MGSAKAATTTSNFNSHLKWHTHRQYTAHIQQVFRASLIHPGGSSMAGTVILISLSMSITTIWGSGGGGGGDDS